MLPGSVLIWPANTVNDEVATISRISFGADHFVIILSDRRRVPLLASPDVIADMRAKYDVARYIRLSATPDILPAP